MNAFTNTLRSGATRPSLGTFIMSASPLVAEAVGCCGFDWVIVDGEHSPLDTMDIAHMLQALGATPTPAIVRVPWNDPVTVKRVLDAGAETLLFPFVQSGEEAAAAVRATRYPPAGIRGMAGLSRASRFGSTPNHFRTANDRLAVLAQVETSSALDHLEEIAAVQGIDALFVGPTDLAGSMGLFGDGSHVDVQRALEDFARRCRAADKPAGTLATTPDQVRRYADLGFSFVAIASDLGLLTGSARAMLKTVRETTGIAKPTAPDAPVAASY